MSPEEIRLELFKRRKIVNMAKIARQLKCSKTAVTLVIDRKSKSQRIMEAVATAIDQPIEKVWPEHYEQKVASQ